MNRLIDKKWYGKTSFLIITLSLLSGFFYHSLFADPAPSESMKTQVTDGKGNKAYTEPMKMPAGAVMINPAQQQLIGVKRYTVEKRKLTKIIRTVGRVEYDERLLGEVNLKVEGWVEKLYADYTGKYVRRGEPLFKLYSPELLNAQEEYLLTTAGRSGAGMKSSAKTRLLLWDISETQINRLERTRKPLTHLDILSPASGYIISKSILEGGHIKPGQTLFKISDIKKVWVLADIYEFELPFVKLGQKVNITTQSLPGQILTGELTYIYPNLNAETRSVKIRVEMENPEERLKPGMFANVQIEIDRGERLAIPESAVLDSGVRKIVFISKGDGVFVPREVQLNSRVHGYYPIQKGLAKGDIVVRSANFFLDSESQLMATMEGMMGLIGMGDWKMEHSKMGEMDMSGMDMSGMGGMKMDEGSDSKTMESMPMNKDGGTKEKVQ
ncbi:MAG: efflux RND transporter periplasmic adaptor subunit [Nitrospinales bacterium]